MMTAFLLGLTGSVGHCVGMCSGVLLLLHRRGVTEGPQLLILHVGRLVAYSVFGMVAGAFGYALHVVLPGLSSLQGGLAMVTAVTALYMSLAILGRVPSPERLFSRITRWWGATMRNQTAQTSHEEIELSLFSVFSLGFLWGCLPCGLVLTAMLTAAASGSPWMGAATMVVFGAGTWPVAFSGSLFVRSQSSRKWLRRLQTWPGLRYGAALVVLLFGTQMVLRGMAAWGWVAHMHVGRMMVW